MDNLQLSSIVTTNSPPGWHDTPNPHALPHCQARHGNPVREYHKITEKLIEVVGSKSSEEDQLKSVTCFIND
ncbi:hypothetical protein M513_11928 [Trichuris suis]|uniref:Uncharacterized protein n=1 Tax=Trichuris suis TaxID=68888 RepID=A0A085LQH5_9BILA|nr:hypothetical protein M513_11928 [Trichuris suis]